MATYRQRQILVMVSCVVGVRTVFVYPLIFSTNAGAVPTAVTAGYGSIPTTK